MEIWVAREIDDMNDETTWEDYFQTIEAAKRDVIARFREVEPKATDELEWEYLTEDNYWYASSEYDKVYYVAEVEVKS